MSVEAFLLLKEYDSLLKMRISQLAQIREQEDRVSKLRARQQESHARQQELQQSLRTLQQNLFETEKKLKTAEEQKTRLIDLGGDEAKIRGFGEEATKLEEEGFSLMGKMEELQVELGEEKTFGQGLEKTISEIGQEAAEAIRIHQQEIDNLNLRLTSSEAQLPEDFRQILKKTLAKNLAIGSFTRIDNGSCFFCRYKMSRIQESEIDMQKALKTCPQCSRIFLPYGA